MESRYRLSDRIRDAVHDLQWGSHHRRSQWQWVMCVGGRLVDNSTCKTWFDKWITSSGTGTADWESYFFVSYRYIMNKKTTWLISEKWEVGESNMSVFTSLSAQNSRVPPHTVVKLCVLSGHASEAWVHVPVQSVYGLQKPRRRGLRRAKDPPESSFHRFLLPPLSTKYGLLSLGRPGIVTQSAKSHWLFNEISAERPI